MKKLIKNINFLALGIITFIICLTNVVAEEITLDRYASKYSIGITKQNKEEYKYKGFYRYKLGDKTAYCVDPALKIVRNNAEIIETINIDLEGCAKSSSNNRNCQLASVFQHGYEIEYNKDQTNFLGNRTSKEKYGATLYAIRYIWGSIDQVVENGYINSRNLIRKTTSYSEYAKKAKDNQAFYKIKAVGNAILSGAYKLYKKAQTNDFWYPQITAPSSFLIEGKDNIKGKEHTVLFNTSFDNNTEISKITLEGPVTYVKHSLKNDGTLKITFSQNDILPENATINISGSFKDKRNFTKIYRYAGASGFQTYLVLDKNTNSGIIPVTPLQIKTKGFDCSNVTVKNFDDNEGKPNLSGFYNSTTYNNLVEHDNKAGTSYAQYYLKHCPKVTCETYDGNHDITSDENNKFNKDKYNSLTDPVHKQHYVDNCPCYCEDYDNDLFNMGCKLPANPPGGKYESDVANKLDDKAYKEYIAHCPPCNPRDGEGSCNLVAACPDESSSSGVTGSILQGDIIDRQVCADAANNPESAADAVDSGFIVDLGTPYCKAACTYDGDEFLYPGAKLGLGSGRFIKFDDIKITMRTTCTTSQINYMQAYVDLHTASENDKKLIIANINKCLDLSNIKREGPIIGFEYQERNDHEGFEVSSTQTTSFYTYCKEKLTDNRCGNIAFGPQEMPRIINSLEQNIYSTTVVFTDIYQYKPKTVYYSTYNEARILTGDIGRKAEENGEAIKIGTDGKVFPINFDTPPGTYEYSLKTNLNNITLDNLQKKLQAEGKPCSLDYTCNYYVHKKECEDTPEDPCNEVDDQDYEPGINSNFRFVSNNDLNPNMRILGKNWLNDKGMKTQKEIEELGDEVYKDENLEYSFILTPSIMNKIRKLNNEAEKAGGFANDTLKCTSVVGQTGYYTCTSTWLQKLFNTTYRMKPEEKLFTSYNGSAWK